jgi:predicted GTPase
MLAYLYLEDKAPAAGWDVEHPSVVRLRTATWAMRDHVEDAWQRDEIDAAIRRALRYKVLTHALHRAIQEHPPLRAHGPHMTYRHAWLEGERQRTVAFRHALERMADNINRELHAQFHATLNPPPDPPDEQKP